MKCIHQMDYWELECSNCDGNRDCCDPPNKIKKESEVMTGNEYQQAALKTANKELGCAAALQHGLMGLSGEAGECIEILKKHLFYGHGLNTTDLANELGDVAWYLAISAEAIGYDLESIFRININKLKERYPDGFSEARSHH